MTSPALPSLNSFCFMLLDCFSWHVSFLQSSYSLSFCSIQSCVVTSPTSKSIYSSLPLLLRHTWDLCWLLQKQTLHFHLSASPAFSRTSAFQCKCINSLTHVLSGIRISSHSTSYRMTQSWVRWRVSVTQILSAPLIAVDGFNCVILSVCSGTSWHVSVQHNVLTQIAKR